MGNINFSNPSAKTRNFHRNYLLPYHRIAKITNNRTGSAKDIHKQVVKAFQTKVLSKAINEKRKVKIKGSKWSLSETPYCEDFIVDINSLTKILPLDSTDIHPSYTGDNSNLIFVQAGRKIKAISNYLFPKGKSLSTSGASNGQTISGAISTGVHGSAFDFGSTQEMIVGLHIIVSETETVYLERLSESHLSDSFASSINAKIVRDDDLFNAALVGVGSFGYVFGIALKVEDLYHLERHIISINKKQALKLGANQKFELSPLLPHPGIRPYHYKLYGNPYRSNQNLIAEILYKKNYDPNIILHKKTISISYFGDMPALVGKIVDRLGGTAKTFANLLDTVLFPQSTDNVMTGTSAEIFADTGAKGSVFGIAIGVEAKNAERVYNAVATQIVNNNVPGLLSVRYVPATKATIGFTRFRKTAIVEVDGVKWDGLDSFLQNTVSLLGNSNMEFTLHWGKNAPWSSTLVKNMYGQRLQDWKKLRNKLIPANIRKAQKNRFSDKIGLS